MEIVLPAHAILGEVGMANQLHCQIFNLLKLLVWPTKY